MLPAKGPKALGSPMMNKSHLEDLDLSGDEEITTDKKVQDVLQADKDLDAVFLNMVNEHLRYLTKSQDLSASIADLETKLKAHP